MMFGFGGLPHVYFCTRHPSLRNFSSKLEQFLFNENYLSHRIFLCLRHRPVWKEFGHRRQRHGHCCCHNFCRQIGAQTCRPTCQQSDQWVYVKSRPKSTKVAQRLQKVAQSLQKVAHKLPRQFTSRKMRYLQKLSNDLVTLGHKMSKSLALKSCPNGDK